MMDKDYLVEFFVAQPMSILSFMFKHIHGGN